jgi:UPF0755 protein
MVQWEAAEPEDMRKVASVFINRLRNPDVMPMLQSDVTDKYIAESLMPYRTSADAVLMDAIIAAYDTYSAVGLPPGPVNNPGMMAMLAVLDSPNLPAESSGYYYFCSNVETGEMFFARDLQTHQANLERAGIDENTARG